MKNRWLMLVTGVWIQITTGSSYVFGLYSESLKRALGYSQTQLDTLGLVKGIGANVGVHTGLLYLVLPPWIIITFGAAHNLLGYIMLYLAAEHKFHLEFWQACLFMLIAANAQTYFNTAVVVTAVTNFPASRGTVIGLMKGCLGLSGAVLTFFYRALHAPGEDHISYLLFAALLPAAVSLLLMFFIKPVPALHQERDESSRLSTISAVALGLAFCLIPSTIVNMNQIFTSVFCVFLLGALALPLLVALKVPVSSTENQEQKSLIAESSSSNMGKEQKTLNRSLRPALGQEYSLTQAFTSAEFWLLVLSTACAMGSGLTTFNNVNQLGLSLGYSTRDVSVVVSLTSIWNFLGRFGAGAVSDYFLTTHGVPRPAFISLALAAMTVGHLIIAAAFPGALYLGTLVVGICYGSQWSLMPATVSEIFGMRQFGTLFNTIAVASPVGEYLLSVRVAGYLYDEEAKKQHSSTSSQPASCSGPQCFRAAFLILAGVCFLGSVCTTSMIYRTRKYYRDEQQKLLATNL